MEGSNTCTNSINTQRKTHAGNATQNIHVATSLMQMTHIHIHPHTLHQSYIYYIVKKTRETYMKQI